MSFSTNKSDTEADWEITSEGLYIAARHFLVRRGYCCANRCRNFPYVNWQGRVDWEHGPKEAVRRISVSAKTLAGVRAQLASHEQASVEAEAGTAEQTYHPEMIVHYQFLLEKWK